MIHLEIKDVSIKNGGTYLCQHFNFSLMPGEVWGILGQNGCGKTTLLHALAGLYPIEKGTVLINNHPSHLLSRKTLAQTIGLLFQEISTLLPQTIWDYCLAARYPHLAYFQKESELDRTIVRQSLQIMELMPLRHRLITTLSGGEKRRLAIAALLSQTPAIYLLDEPTNHLDIRHQIAALHHFRQLAKKSSATVVMALHDINLAQQFCDAVLLMFPAGNLLPGKARDILTADNLTRLYQHSIVPITIDGTVIWQPRSLSFNR